MRHRADCGLACILAGWLTLTALPSAARAQLDPWANRPGSVLIESRNSLDWYSRRAHGERSALEGHWESQRQAQMASAHQRSPARYGFFGGYYAQQTSARNVAPIESNACPISYGSPHSGDFEGLDFEYSYDIADPLDFGNLCSHRSPGECLDDLPRTGRR
jgi:hypothetical protein